MGQLLYESFDKQDAIMASVVALFTHEITSQTDSGVNILLTISSPHNFQLNGILNISGVVDGEGEALENYNQAFDIVSIPDTTSVLIAKDQGDKWGFEVEYDATADFSGASLTNLRVHNDPALEFATSDYPVLIVDVDDTLVNKTAGGEFAPDETLFPMSLLHRLDQFTIGEKTQLRSCRYFVAYKMQQILDNIELKVVSNVGRLETIYGSEDVSVIGTTVKQ